jgi:hypothetical protein
VTLLPGRKRIQPEPHPQLRYKGFRIAGQRYFHCDGVAEATKGPAHLFSSLIGRGQLKCDRTRTEARFLLSAKRTSPFKSAGASVQWTAGSRGVRISGSNAGYTMFRGSVKSTGYPLHSPVSTSLPFLCVTVCHHISVGVYLISILTRKTLAAKHMPLVFFFTQC